MSEKQNLFENFEDARLYVESAREHYRNEHGEYRGRRTEEQQLIAEVTADEARTIVDGTMVGILAVMGGGAVELPTDYETEVTKADFTWKDFRGEFERLLVGFGVMTNRLARDGYGVPGYADLGAEDRLKAASILFSDYLQHNALRFGVETAGLHRSKTEVSHNDDGGVDRTRVIFDPDKAKGEKELEKNMRNRGYATGVAAHPAGKISPEEYVQLRNEFPEVDKDAFDRDVSFYTHVRQEYENKE